MNTAETLMTDAKLKLAKSLNKWHSFNVSNCSSKFYDADFRLFVIISDGYFSYIFNPVLNGICYMWNN